MSQRWKLALIVGSIVLAALCFAPVRHCCGEDDEAQKRFEVVLGHAFNGDVSATKQLYDESAAVGDMYGTHQWALLGAIQGDTALADIYLNQYKSLPDNERESDLAILKKNASSIGASQLIRMIEKR